MLFGGRDFGLLISMLLVLIQLGCTVPGQNRGHEKPNILLIYCDDLGYGDPGCYNPGSRIPTPNIDRLAGEGILFTDAHSPAAICGPSRYGLLTGRYSWRKVDGASNGPAFGDLRIENGRLTLASILKSQGYNTAQMGKWGLRHNYGDALKEGLQIAEELTKESFDFPEKRLLGANLCGFEYAWSLPHLSSHKNTKYAFENGLPLDPELKEYDAHRWLPDGTRKAVDYLEVYAGKKEYEPFHIDRSKPFFLYWDPHVPHLPVVPNIPYLGGSSAGDYGDFVFELDHCIGEILKALERNGLKENTLVIFSSDNGPEQTAYDRIIEYRHYSMGEWRGVKRDNWEGGTRVPLIIRWPGKISPGSVNETPICLTDLMATFAGILGVELPAGQGEDSYSVLPLLTGGNPAEFARAPVIYHTFEREMAIREGPWVLIDAPTGMQSKEPVWFRNERGVQEHSEPVELFHLVKDPRQLENLAAEYPEKVAAMKKQLEGMITSGSTCER